MILLLIALFYTSNASSEDINVCVGVECEKFEVYKPSERGKFLIAPPKNAIKKMDGPQLSEGDKLPSSFKHVAREINDLRFTDLYVGKCLYNPNKADKFYKILEVDSKSKFVRYVIEEVDHNNSLKLNSLLFRSNESYVFKKLKGINCRQTPHLADDKYLKKCIGTRTAGTLLCDFDKRF